MNFIRRIIRRTIATDEALIVRLRAELEPGVDCAAIEDDIARLQHRVRRMRSLL